MRDLNAFTISHAWPLYRRFRVPIPMPIILVADYWSWRDDESRDFCCSTWRKIRPLLQGDCTQSTSWKNICSIYWEWSEHRVLLDYKCCITYWCDCSRAVIFESIATSQNACWVAHIVCIFSIKVGVYCVTLDVVSTFKIPISQSTLLLVETLYSCSPSKSVPVVPSMNWNLLYRSVNADTSVKVVVNTVSVCRWVKVNTYDAALAFSVKVKYQYFVCSLLIVSINTK